MKHRILTTAAIALCVVVMLFGEIAPAMAYAPPDGEGEAVVQAEEVCWFFRTKDGVREKRLWSITRGVWISDWIPA